MRRPYGYYRPSIDENKEDNPLVFEPTKKLDYELEVAAFIGQATTMGERVKLTDAEDLIFGLVLVNDWSGKSLPPSEQLKSYERSPCPDP